MGARSSKSTKCSLGAATDILGKKIIDHCVRTCSVYSDAGELVEVPSENSEKSTDQAPTYIFEAILAKHECGTSYEPPTSEQKVLLTHMVTQTFL